MSPLLFGHPVVTRVSGSPDLLSRVTAPLDHLFRGKSKINAKKTPAPPPTGHSHQHGPGWGWSLFGFVVWLIEMRDGIVAILAAYIGCSDVSSCIDLTLNMPGATFAGVAFWVVANVSSTVALVLFVLGKLKWPGDDDKDEGSEEK